MCQFHKKMFIVRSFSDASPSSVIGKIEGCSLPSYLTLLKCYHHSICPVTDDGCLNWTDNNLPLEDPLHRRK